MKATLVFNTKEEPRLLLEMESMEECAAMENQPDLECVRETHASNKLLDLGYTIKPTYRTAKFFGESYEEMTDEQKLRYLHAEYGQLKLKYLSEQAVLKTDIARLKRQEQWVVDEGKKIVDALRKEVDDAKHGALVAEARLAKLIRACQSRKVGEQWPVIAGVIKSFGKVEHT